MFNFFNEIFSESERISDLKIMCTKTKCYIQGFKDFLRLESTEIILKVKTGEISVKGKNLTIQELNEGSVLIAGTINYVDLGGGNEK